ncbi:MAG: GTP-binding protein, partial [Eubacteriales bacterium]
MTKLDVITGFLGAGKTTFLTRYTAWLAGQGIRYAVIENEFGRAGVDAALLEQRGARVLEISGGCVCCTLKVGLHDMLHALCGEVDRILLEPSGLFCGDDLLDIVNSPDMSIEPGFWLGIVDP